MGVTFSISWGLLCKAEETLGEVQVCCGIYYFQICTSGLSFENTAVSQATGRDAPCPLLHG